MADTSRSLRVFISYARSDSSAFAEELMAGLEAAGFDPFLDRHDISPGEPWEDRLRALLQQADTVVYVISTASVASERCSWEIDLAEKLSKRVIPVVAIEVAEANTPAKLRRLNYIFFSTGHPFGAALRELSMALRTDLTWVREHTRLGDLAARWRDDHKPEDRLLRGTDLTAARAWLVAWKPGAPEPTSAHRDFINESEAAEARLNSVEQKRLEEVARVQAENGVVLKRLRRITLASAGLVAVLFALTAIFFVVQLNTKRQLATKETELDDKNLELAEATRVSEERRADLERAQASLSEALSSAQATTNSTVTPERRESILKLQALVQQAKVDLGWKLDIFWCAGPGAVQNKARADAIVQALTDEKTRQAQTGAGPDQLTFTIGSVDARELTEAKNAGAGYRLHDDVVRPEGTEVKQADALRAFIQRQQGTPLRVAPSAMKTLSYLSVFLCSAPKS